MFINIFKNPIILALLAAAITYLYMWWENENKYKKNPKSSKESISLITPLIVGLIVLFITYNYFGLSNKEIISDKNQIAGVQIIDANPIKNKMNMSDRFTDTFDSKTYRLIGKNTIKLPQTDVFIDIAKF
jgi:hypothetical protein